MLINVQILPTGFTHFLLTLSLPESNLESINVAVPFESVDESYSVLSSRPVCF